MSKQVKIGIVGTSWWTDSMYMPALTKHPNAAVRAIVGRNLDHAREFAEQWRVPNVYASLDELLANESIDAVIIASSNKHHYAMAMTAIQHGLHVLCEKPLAMNYTEAIRMTEAAETADIKTMVSFTYRFMPTARYLKELIEQGYIGRPYHLNMRYYADYARDGKYMWRFDLAESGSGVVGDLGTHWLYLADWFYGEIAAVTAMLGYHVRRGPRPDGQPYQPADDSAVMMLEFENGARGVLHVSSLAYEPTPFGQTHHMEFHGSGGTLYSFTDWDKTQSVSGARDGEGPIHDLSIPDHIWGTARRDIVPHTYKDVFRDHDFMARGFVSAIANDASVEPSFRDGARIQRYLEAALLSAEEGRRVEVNEIQAKE
jgi:levoglucosan dehydrogenase